MRSLAYGLLVAVSATPAMAQRAPAAAPQYMVGPTRLVVSAEGDVTRVPDIATISAGVVTQAPTASVAMSQNAQKMAATLAALRKAGIEGRDIQTASINLSPQYRYADNVPPVITGYQASNQVNVRFRDVKRAGAVLDVLVAQGANQINGPTFGLDNEDAALDEARTNAVEKARARAELYARAAGMRVKRILHISENVSHAAPPQPMAMSMMARSEKSDTVIEAGDQKYSVTVEVAFELE